MPFNDRLFHLLDGLEDDELMHLWVHCLGNKPEQDGFAGALRRWRITHLSEVWRAINGNVLRNLTRGPHDLPWKQILIDAADRLTPGLKGAHFRLDDSYDEESIEQAVLDLYDTRVGPLWSGLTAKERKKISIGAGLPGGSGVVELIASGASSIAKDRSLAATLTLLTAHERRRLLKLNLDRVAT